MGRFSISRKKPLAVRPPAYSYFCKKIRDGVPVLALGVIQNVKGIPSTSAAGAGDPDASVVPSFFRPWRAWGGADPGASRASLSSRPLRAARVHAGVIQNVKGLPFRPTRRRALG